jgi:hypothetical protein
MGLLFVPPIFQISINSFKVKKGKGFIGGRNIGLGLSAGAYFEMGMNILLSCGKQCMGSWHAAGKTLLTHHANTSNSSKDM